MSFYAANVGAGLLNTGICQVGGNALWGNNLLGANQWTGVAGPVGPLGPGGQVGQGSTGDVDPLRIGTHLFGDRPAASDLTVPDVTYPLDVDMASSEMRFHLLTWRYSGDHSPLRWWQMIEITTPTACDTTQAQAGRLAFYTRHDRRRFQRWWHGYSKRFYAGIPPRKMFLPVLRPGHVSGSFVAHPTVFDTQPYGVQASGLLETLPAWAWIVRRCRRPVFRINGGWLFTSATEAALFALFTPVGLFDDAVV